MKPKKPLTKEEMEKRLKDAVSDKKIEVSERERQLNNITAPKPKDSLQVNLEGKTGRPQARSFGYKDTNQFTKLNEVLGYSKKSDRTSWENLKNRWEDIEYGAEKKKKKVKK
jgi:G:T/U-mismatch repair DNA glycosylase